MITAVLLVFSREAARGVTEGLTLCATTVIPALFPTIAAGEFFIAVGGAEILAAPFGRICQKVFALNGRCASVILLGLTGGFPSGAAAAVRLYRDGGCSADEAERLIAFTNNASPAFLLGALGIGMLGDIRLGVALFTAQTLSSLIIGVISRPRNYHPDIPCKVCERQIGFINAFSAAIASSAETGLKICASICFFGAVSAVMRSFNIGNTAGVLISGLMELSGGCAAASLLPLSAVSFALIGWMTGLSEMAVFFQVASIASGAGLSMRRYLMSKLLSSGICAVLSAAFYLLSEFFK